MCVKRACAHDLTNFGLGRGALTGTIALVELGRPFTRRTSSTASNGQTHRKNFDGRPRLTSKEHSFAGPLRRGTTV